MATTVFSQAQDGVASTVKKTFSRATSVSIKIESDPSILWTLLTQASDIPRWNSTIISLEGDIAVGEKIKLKSIVDTTRAFKLKVKEMTAEKEMIWASGAAPFFKGMRVYILTPNADGSTTFSMSEKIGGLMFPMAAGSIPPFDASFEQFAKDLKTEAELISKTKS